MLTTYILKLLITAPPILLALTVHECAHAFAAYRLGDPTAKMLGRLTLNPLRHLDPIGTIALFLTGMFGWAKPVPVIARNFRNPAKGMMIVSLAGPFANLLLGAFFALFVIAERVVASDIPVALHGVYDPVFLMIKASVVINVSLAVFNLIPIPPLDGSHVLGYFLPSGAGSSYSRFSPYGFILLLALISSGVIGRLISPIIAAMIGLLTGGVY